MIYKNKISHYSMHLIPFLYKTNWISMELNNGGVITGKKLIKNTKKQLKVIIFNNDVLHFELQPALLTRNVLRLRFWGILGVNWF